MALKSVFVLPVLDRRLSTNIIITTIYLYFFYPPEQVNLWLNFLKHVWFVMYGSICFQEIFLISPVIRQKGESQNGCSKKTKHVKLSKKRTFLTLLIRTRTCAYQGVRNVRFSEILACFVFLKHLF